MNLSLPRLQEILSFQIGGVGAGSTDRPCFSWCIAGCKLLFLLNATHNVLSHNESRRKGSFPFILLLEKNPEANAPTANNAYLWVVELEEELTSYSICFCSV